MKKIVVVIALIYLVGISSATYPPPLLNQVDTAPKVEIVTNVKDFRDYTPRWSNRFPPGTTVKIYVEALDVNHAKIIGTDFYFIMKDPEGHIVDWTPIKVRKIGYDENIYVVYSKKISDSWIEGKYTVKIYAYDRVNFGRVMNLEYSYLSHIDDEDFWEDFFDVGDDDNSLGILNPISSSRVVMRNRKIYFYVDKNAGRYPPDWFTISDMKLVPSVLSRGEEAYVTVNVENTYDESGTAELSLLLDNRTIGMKSVKLGPGENSTIDFGFKVPEEGEHVLEIRPMSEYTWGKNLKITFKILTELPPEENVTIPTEFVIKDLKTDKFKVGPLEPVSICVKVQNMGKRGNDTIEIDINGEKEDEKTVTLKYMEIKNICFNVTKELPGTYRITIPGTKLSTTFFVIENESIPSSPLVLPQREKVPDYVVIALLVILGILVGLRLYIAKK
ncbi:MAG: COG1470 family protein [Candidatus Syntropharchaeia archaeon]